MITNEDKLYLINLKLNFWKERLLESNKAIAILNDLRNQIKIDSNLDDINRYTKIIYLLEIEKKTLTNQG